MDTLQSILASIKQQIKEKKYSEADSLVSSCLLSFPNQINLLCLAHQACIALEDYQRSSLYATKIIEHYPLSRHGYVRVAESLFLLNQFDDALLILRQGLSKLPDCLELLCAIYDIHDSKGDYYQSLKSAQEILIKHPETHLGNNYLAKALIKLGHIEKAKETIKDGLELFPNQINLLCAAHSVYRKSTEHNHALIFAEKLIEYYPRNFNGYLRSIQELISLHRFDDALKVFTSVDIQHIKHKELESLRSPLLRRKLLIQKIKETELIIARDYPHFAIAGNCQMRPLHEWLALSFPHCKIFALPPYQAIQSQEELDSWMHKAADSDIVMMIPLKSPYRGFEFGSDFVKSQLHNSQHFINYPSLHLEVFFPFFGYAKTSTGSTLRGNKLKKNGHLYGDSHDFLAMATYTESEYTQHRLIQNIIKASSDKNYFSQIICDNAVASFLEFKRRYPSFVQPFYQDISKGMFHSFNHPKGSALSEVYSRLWEDYLFQDPLLFKPYRRDRLGKTPLPIPQFVVTTIFSAQSEYPWKRTNPEKLSTVSIAHDQYIANLRRSIMFYRENPKIVESNLGNRKFLMAKSFIEELCH